MITVKHEVNGDNNDDGVVPKEYQSMMIGLAEVQDRWSEASDQQWTSRRPSRRTTRSPWALTGGQARDWRGRMTNERKQREKAVVTRRGERWGICTGRIERGADWLAGSFSGRGGEDSDQRVVRTLTVLYCQDLPHFSRLVCVRSRWYTCEF